MGLNGKMLTNIDIVTVSILLYTKKIRAGELNNS